MIRFDLDTLDDCKPEMDQMVMVVMMVKMIVLLVVMVMMVIMAMMVALLAVILPPPQVSVVERAEGTSKKMSSPHVQHFHCQCRQNCCAM